MGGLISASVARLVASLKAAAGAGLVGFAQSGVGAAVRTALAKMREIEVSVTDFGAVEGGVVDIAPALNKAFQASKVMGIPCGTVKVPAGRWRVASLLDWDLGQNPVDAVLGDAAGTYRQFSLVCDGTLVFDAGAGIKVQRGYNPKFILKVEGGALADAALWMENEVVSPYFEIYGNMYQGTLFKTLGTTAGPGAKEGVKTLHGGFIVNQSCGQSLYLAGTSGLGHLDSVWDLTPTKGPELVDCWDFSIAHYENYTSTARSGGTFKVTRGGGHHFGTIAMGNRALPYMEIIEAIDIEIANLNLADTDKWQTGVVIRGGSVNIANVTCVGIDRGIVVGNGAFLTIGNLHAHHSGTALLLDYDAVRGGVSNVFVNVSNFVSKESWGTTDKGVRGVIVVAGGVTGGWLKIGGGGIVTGNYYGEPNVTVIDIQAEEAFTFAPSNFTVDPHNGPNSLAVKYSRSLMASNCQFSGAVFDSRLGLLFSDDGRTVMYPAVESPMVAGYEYDNLSKKKIRVHQPVLLTPTAAAQATAEAYVDFGAGYMPVGTLSAPKNAAQSAGALNFEIPVGARYKVLMTNAATVAPTTAYTL
jgi:hypothetical protein